MTRSVYTTVKRHGELLAVVILVLAVFGALIAIYAEEQPGTSAAVESRQMLNILSFIAKITGIVVFVSLLAVLIIGVLVGRLRRIIGI